MTAIPLVTHAALVARAIRWLRDTRRCKVILSEMNCNWLEVPDAIGFHDKQGSVLVECKCSRGDFHTDARKKSRREGVGMGSYRFYLVPHGLVRSHEFETLIAGEEQSAETVTNFKWGSNGWGLLWWDPQSERVSVQRISQRFSENRGAENRLLISALHRVQLRLTEPLHEYIRWESSYQMQKKKAEGAHA